MALKDLKSDLSKFRMPKKEPLVNKKREPVKKKQNQTPLSSMLKSKPNLETSDKTPTKQGTKVNKFDNSSKFLGEANPSKFDNSSNFLGETKQTPMDNSSNFLGETDNVKFDNSSNFLGETNPNTFDNSSNFLGETNPNTFDNSSNFLGETTPNIFSNSSNFLGETNPNIFSNSSNFLGETNPNTFDNSPNFLGETTPTPVDFITNDNATGFTFNFKNKENTKFIGVDPSNTIFDSTNSLYSNFLNSSNGISFSAGYDGFKPVGSFTGDTQRYNPDTKYSTDSFKELAIPSNGILTGQDGAGFINYNWGVRASYAWNNGFTTFRPGYGSFKFNTALSAPQYSGLNAGDDFHYTTDTHNLKQVDRGLLQLQDGTGFLNHYWATNAFGAFYASQTHSTTFRPGYGSFKFNNTPLMGSIYSGLNLGDDFHYTTDTHNLKQVDRGLLHLQTEASTIPFVKQHWIKNAWDSSGWLRFRPGYQNYKFTDYIENPRFLYGTTYTDDAKAQVPNLTNSSIQDLHQKANSKSFLDRMYDKFHLKDDSPNFSYPNRAFQQPFILRGIQREGGEPEHYGQFGLSFDDGLIRGGVISSTVRAGLDVARIGSWLLTPKGLVWQLKQASMQLTNKFKGIWTPTNLLLAAGGQHLGMKPQRGGIIPFHDPFGAYQKVIPTGTDSLGSFYGPWYKHKLLNIYNLDLKDPFCVKGSSFVTQMYFGGPTSFYGLGLSTTTRGDNTFMDKRPFSSKAILNSKAGLINRFDPTDIIITKYAPQEDGFNAAPSISNPFKSVPSREKTEDLKNFGLTHTPAPSIKSKSEVAIVVSPIGLPEVKDTITDYETIAYSKLPERGDYTDGTVTHDFRSLLTGKGKTTAKSADYNSNNIQAKRGFGNPGKIGVDRSKWWTDLQATYDEVNANPIDGNIKADLVHLWFKAYGDDTAKHKTVQFRCTVTGLSDTFSPSWNPIKYNGRADQAYQYSSFSRSVGFNFKVIATSRQEMKPIWEKLQYLSTMTMPQYKDNKGYHGTLVQFRLGDLYNNKLCFISSLSYTMMDETPWEINDLAHTTDKIGELPMGVGVQIGLTILDDVQPEINSKVYDWNFDTAHEAAQIEEEKRIADEAYANSPAGLAQAKAVSDLRAALAAAAGVKFGFGGVGLGS